MDIINKAQWYEYSFKRLNDDGRFIAISSCKYVAVPSRYKTMQKAKNYIEDVVLKDVYGSNLEVKKVTKVPVEVIREEWERIKGISDYYAAFAEELWQSLSDAECEKEIKEMEKNGEKNSQYYKYKKRIKQK